MSGFEINVPVLVFVRSCWHCSLCRYYDCSWDSRLCSLALVPKRFHDQFVQLTPTRITKKTTSERRQMLLNRAWGALPRRCDPIRPDGTPPRSIPLRHCRVVTSRGCGCSRWPDKGSVRVGKGSNSIKKYEWIGWIRINFRALAVKGYYSCDVFDLEGGLTGGARNRVRLWHRPPPPGDQTGPLTVTRGLCAEINIRLLEIVRWLEGY